jgi:hypothetical protein
MSHFFTFMHYVMLKSLTIKKILGKKSEYKFYIYKQK